MSGGIGGRGPGETKLEIGRRRARDRISELETRIEKLSQERSLRRKKRREGEIPLVSILGYTNVGKSTLFNALTKSTVLVEDKLFATLDPSKRKLYLPAVGPKGKARAVVLSDTVGFIRDLPKELFNAFRATLEELYDAALLIHVVDASDSSLVQKKEAVEKILGEMGLSEVPTVIVLNKTDQSPEQADLLGRELNALPVSATKKSGLDRLLIRIQSELKSGLEKRDVSEATEVDFAQ